MSASTSGSDAMAPRRSDVTRNSSREQASCGSLSDFKPTYTVMFASDGEMRLRKCCANCLAEVCGPRLCCNECAGLVLCPECFSAGAELGTHRRMHSYRWEDGGFAPLIGGPMPWGAHEEELLLEAVEQHGLGNWEGAAAAMGGSRSASDVAAHFFAVYIEGNLGQACLPPHVTSRVHDHNTASQLPLSSPPEQLNLSSLEQGALGFAPLRGDFDVEPDPGAESLVASLCFDPATEDDLEMELKRALASVYVQRLRERHRRKAVALDYGLIDTFFGHSTGRSFGLTSQLSVESRKSNSTTNSGLTQTSFDGRKSGKAGANATGNSISGLTSAISTDSRKAAKLCGNTAANTSAASGILVSMNGSCETRRALPMEPRTRLPALFGIVTCKELDKLEEMLRRERALRTRVRELQRWRRHGVTAVTDGAGFEAAARLQRAPKPADALTTTEGSLATFASTFSLPSTNAFPAASWDFLSMGEKAVCDVAGLAPGQYITTKATLLLQGPGRPGGGSGTGNVGLDRQQWKRVQRFLVRNRWYGPRQAA